ncbi:MAG TPA: calcium-binding protein [Anaerolineales bacterium]|nr:calcium-binding protein [Anaerolineales bacterium]
MRDCKVRSSRRKTARKNLRRHNAHLDALIAEAIMDAYNESEQTIGFYTMIENSLALPFVTEILGIKVAVEQIDMNEDNAIVAVCQRGGREFQFWIFHYHRQRQEELNGLQLIATGERSARERVSVL